MLSEPGRRLPRDLSVSSFALFASMLALVPLAVPAAVYPLVQRDSRGLSRGLSVAALVLCVVWTTTLGWFVGAHTGLLTDLRLATSGVEATSLRVGQCFVTGSNPEIALPVSCSQRHDGIVYFTQELPAGPYPGADQLRAVAHEVCGARLADLSRQLQRPDFMVYRYVVPTRDVWAGGNRAFMCSIEADQLAGPTISARPWTHDLDATT